tara:strand:- start:535 stop:3030 length:2496 start_codon:yes stop_codon:yes gene_type:complete
MTVSFTITGNAMYMGSFISPPNDPVEGNIYYNTTDAKVYIYIDNDWQELGGGSGSGSGTNGTDGDSAFDIALENGFLDDEAAWLASLVGDTGEQGIQGIQGIHGPQGETGQHGHNGTDGADGTNGIDGADGGGGGDGIINSYTTIDLPTEPPPGTIVFNITTQVPIYYKNGGWYLISDDTLTDTTSPEITNIVHIPTPSTNKTPLISFYSSEIGTITSTLPFSQTPSIVAEMNIITFDTLPFGPYTDETITITDTVGNPLTFTIETFEVMELHVVIHAMNMAENSNITFVTNAVGTFTSTLAFSSTNVTALGSNTIIFETLSQGSYTDENVVIHDNFGNSLLIPIPDFDIIGDVNGTPIDNIGDKLIWLDADDDNTFASDVFEVKVNYWNDKSEYGWQLTPDTKNGPDSSIRVQHADGTHSVQFNWSSMKNSDFNILEYAPYTFYIVMKCNDQDGKNTIFDSSSWPGDAKNTIFDSSSLPGRNLLMTNGSSLKFLSGNSYNSFSPLGDVRRRLLVGYVAPRGANSTIDIGDGKVKGFISGGPPTLSGLVVGGVGGGFGSKSNSLKGDIHEFIIFNGGLAAAEDTAVRNYLNTKWFLTALDSINKLGWWSAYDVSDFTLDANNNVLTWTDKAGSNDLQQVDDKYATRSSNDGEGVSFNGSSSLTNPDFNIARSVAYTAVLVFKKTEAASLSWLIDSVDITSSRNMIYSNSDGHVTTYRLHDGEFSSHLASNHSFTIYTNNNNALGDKDILIINFNETKTTGSIFVHSNTEQTFTTGSLGSGAMDGITVGSLDNGTPGYGLNGMFYEIIYFDGIINTEETTIVRDYLKDKWDI